MEESEKEKMFLEIIQQDDLREDSGRELRGMELQAYSNVVDALRAEGSLDKDKKGVLENLRKYFNISEARHTAEVRRANSNDKLLAMAERLQDVDSETVDETWTAESYGVFPPLPTFHRRAGGSREPFHRSINVVEEDPPPQGMGISSPIKLLDGYDKFKAVSDDTVAYAKFKWDSRVKKVHKKVQTKISTLQKHNRRGSNKEIEFGSSEESELDVKNEHERSPDIIDAASPPKNNKTSQRRGVVTKTTRGPKRKASLSTIPMEDHHKRQQPCNNPPPARIAKKLNFNKGFGKTKGKFPKIKFVKRRCSTPEISSDEEVTGDDDKTNKPVSPAAAKPIIRITAPTPPTTTRGRGMRARGRGVSRGRGRGRTVTPNMAYRTFIDPEDASRSESFVSPVKRTPATYPTKPVKTLKPKKPKPVSLSRRKSRLKEKEDDDMQVEWNDDDDALIISNKHIPIKKRKLLPDESSQSEVEMEKPENIGIYPRNHHAKHHFENGEMHKETLVGRVHQLHQNYLSPPNDIHGGRVLDVLHHHHRSPQLSGDETDSASEKGSITGRNNESPGTNSSASSPPLARQKQRLKSPLNLTPQLPRINIPPPVFSTSLSNVQKKRTQKHISVVDSLNLHLPTTPTASSLASSARRPSMPTGSSIFSNQAIVLARACGSPGILQTRKATPHILSNSKTIQRTYIPTTSISSSSANPVGGMCVSMGGTTINLSSGNHINSLVSSTGTMLSPGVQVQSNIIPSSGLLQLPTSNHVGISGSIPMGTVAGGSRAPGPAPIILVQKANASNNPNVPTSTIGLQSNTMPPKTGSRAVILRRTTQPHQLLPRSQGNVMILDVQNKSISNQMHPFLQPVSRILTAAPSEVSVINIQGGQPQSMMIQPQSSDLHLEPKLNYKSATAPAGSHRKQKLAGNEIIFTSTIPDNATVTSRKGQNDTQLAQIEAELLEMEQEIAYEEEVVTTLECPHSNLAELQNQRLYTIPINPGTCTAVSSVSVNSDNSFTPSPAPADNYSLGVVEQQNLQQISEAMKSTAIPSAANSPVKIINTTLTEENAQNHNSQYSHEDIFQTALKSSGIVFTDQQYYDVEVEEMCENDDSQQHSVDVINHIIVGSQENGDTE